LFLGLNERLKEVKSYFLADKIIIHCNLSSVNRQNKKNFSYRKIYDNNTLDSDFESLNYDVIHLFKKTVSFTVSLRLYLIFTKEFKWLLAQFDCAPGHHAKAKQIKA